MNILVQRTAPARETMPRLFPSAWGVFPVGSAPRRATKRDWGNDKSGPNTEGFGRLAADLFWIGKAQIPRSMGAFVCLCRYSTSTSTCEIL